jgi:CubicO group peptidase (beta-lactamase class C family)
MEDTPLRRKELPSHPNLEHLQKQAKDRVKENPSLQLAAAQHQVAQEYGFKNWAELARTVDKLTAATPPLPKTKRGFDTADEFKRRLKSFNRQIGGGIAAVWVDTKEKIFFEAGIRSKYDTSPITPETVFFAFGLTKVFTALLLSESERLGRVSRLDPAAKYLFGPDDPSQRILGQITLLSLATHTSGLPPWPLTATPLNFNGIASYDRPKLIEAFRTAPKKAEPGGPAMYSNFGIALLGEALAAAWGVDFAEVLRERVLAPLDMSASGFSFKAFASTCGLKTSTQDLVKFLAAALGDGMQPLRPAFEATLQPQFERTVSRGYQGLGWMLTNGTEHPIAWHNGAIGNDCAFMAVNRSEGTALAILTTDGIRGKRPDGLGFDLLGVKLPSRE